MTNDMAGSMFIHPPGGLPDGAPKGLVDVWMTTSPPLAEQTKQAVMDAVHTHALAISLWAVALILLIGVSIWFFRDWRGHLLRWQIRRLQRLLHRDSTNAPEPVGAALMWAVARYFRMHPAVDRRALPPEWQIKINYLDTLRFGPPTPTTDWQALLDDMSALTRQVRAAQNPVAAS